MLQKCEIRSFRGNFGNGHIQVFICRVDGGPSWFGQPDRPSILGTSPGICLQGFRAWLVVLGQENVTQQDITETSIRSAETKELTTSSHYPDNQSLTPMSLKRNRNAIDTDDQQKQSPFVFYGTALPPQDHEARDDGSYVPLWKQEVTDERGRKRLHGAFTGGFSAGYVFTWRFWS